MRRPGDLWGVIPLGLRPTLFVGAIGASLAVLPLLFSPVRSLTRVPDEAQSSPPIAAANSAPA